MLTITLCSGISKKSSECVWKLLLLVLQHVQWSTGNLWSIDISHVLVHMYTPRHVEICWKGETDSDCVSEYRSVGPGANTGTMVGSVWTEKGGRGVLQTKVASQVEQDQNHKSDCCRVKTSVVDPEGFITDPDPTVQKLSDPTQASYPDSKPIPGSGDYPKLEQIFCHKDRIQKCNRIQDPTSPKKQL